MSASRRYLQPEHDSTRIMDRFRRKKLATVATTLGLATIGAGYAANKGIEQAGAREVSSAEQDSGLINSYQEECARKALDGVIGFKGKFVQGKHRRSNRGFNITAYVLSNRCDNDQPSPQDPDNIRKAGDGEYYVFRQRKSTRNGKWYQSGPKVHVEQEQNYPYGAAAIDLDETLTTKRNCRKRNLYRGALRAVWKPIDGETVSKEHRSKSVRC